IVSRGDVATLTAALGTPYAAILPGQRVRAFLTDIPDRIKGAERVDIARFAHEDQLATDPDGLHIVVGSGDPATTLMVARDDMDAVLDRLEPSVILADFDALADLTGDDIALLDRVVSPGPQGVSVDRDWVDGPVTVLDDDTIARSIFSRLDGSDYLNLRHGAYRRRTQIQTGPWARIAAMALVCGLLGLGLSWADSRAMAGQADALRDEARALYTEATGQPAPDNLSRLARTATAEQTNGDAFLVLSDHLFGALSRHPDITVERLTFESRENSLRLRLVYPGFEAASALEATVGDMGGVFVTGGVREQNGRFIGTASLSLEETS
ncbi:MAG: type II secretion system protein GspL, partial [Pseudomonadota bacterium]